MRITVETDFPAVLYPKPQNPSPDSNLLLKPGFRSPSRRRTRNPRLYSSGVRPKKEVGTPAVSRSRPQTSLLQWKCSHGKQNVSLKDKKSQLELGGKFGRNVRSGYVTVSVRKLAAQLWRLQLPDIQTNVSEQLGFCQAGVDHVGVQFLDHQNGKANAFQLANSSMEGRTTKWDATCLKTSNNSKQICGHSKFVNQYECAAPMVSALEQARARIHELENEQYLSKEKLEHFLKKLSKEKATWQSKELEKIRAIIDDMKSELRREKKLQQRMEVVNSKLVNELTKAKLSVKCYMQEYEKERKARLLVEEVCDELAKEIAEDKAEIEALKRESMTFQEELEEERKILQMAEIWREERVQMKLVDAKVALEEKYSQMNMLVADLESFLNSRISNLNVEEIGNTEALCQAAASVNIQDIKEFRYDPPNPDDIWSVFEDVQMVEPNGREIEQCVAYSPAGHASKIQS